MRGDKRVERIVIKKLGPIDYCDFNINDFTIFTGPQASGKSTIAKSIFFFKNIRNLIVLHYIWSFLQAVEIEKEIKKYIFLMLKKTKKL